MWDVREQTGAPLPVSDTQTFLNLQPGSSMLTMPKALSIPNPPYVVRNCLEPFHPSRPMSVFYDTSFLSLKFSFFFQIFALGFQLFETQLLFDFFSRVKSLSFRGISLITPSLRVLGLWDKPNYFKSSNKTHEFIINDLIETPFSPYQRALCMEGQAQGEGWPVSLVSTRKRTQLSCTARARRKCSQAPEGQHGFLYTQHYQECRCLNMEVSRKKTHP